MDRDILLPIVGTKQRPMHCGPVCIELVLKFYGFENMDQAIIGKDLNVKGNRGCFPRDVIKYLKRYNITAEKSKAITDIEKISEGRPIFLGQRDHFMLLIGREGDNFIYIDPATGRRNRDTLEWFKKEVVDLVLITHIGEHDGRKGKTKKKW